MAAKDDSTLAWYSREADVYAAQDRVGNSLALRRFLSQLPAGASVLELGCGSGEDSETMLAAGFEVTPTDGTPAMAAAAAKRLRRPVPVMLFDELRDENTYDGVWANASLLHIPRSDLPGILTRIHTALRPSGIFYASFKAGTAEGRDRFGRFYNYPDEAWLRQAYASAAWSSLTVENAHGSGYDKQPTDWLLVTAVKEA